MDHDDVFSRTETGILLGIALIFDAISFIPVLNIVSGFVAWLFMFTAFKFKGVSFLANKSILMRTVGGVIIGIIPVVSALPEFTTVVFLNIRSINRHARKQAAKQKAEQPIVVNRTIRVDTVIEEPADDYRVRMNKSNTQAYNMPNVYESSVKPYQPRVSKTIQFGRTIPQMAPRTSMMSRVEQAELKTGFADEAKNGTYSNRSNFGTKMDSVTYKKAIVSMPERIFTEKQNDTKYPTANANSTPSRK